MGGEGAGVEGGAGGVTPEAETVGAGVVAEEVEGDAGEPGVRGAVAAELGAGRPGAEEGFLGEGFGEVAVAGGGEEEPQDARVVEGVEGFQSRQGGGREGLPG